ncbi:hypothetical protein IJG73_02380 [Candidatus Saccharibacteria bacterium]|nr:hypothetical protein [Candidatus Saccharibacteria bacterium]
MTTPNKKQTKGAKAKNQAPEKDVIDLPKKVYNANWKDDVDLSEAGPQDELGFETFNDEAEYESPKEVSEEALAKQLEWAKKQKIGQGTLSVVSLLRSIKM